MILNLVLLAVVVLIPLATVTMASFPEHFFDGSFDGAASQVRGCEHRVGVVELDGDNDGAAIKGLR